MQRYLQDYFWRCALSGRFSSSVETKLAQDIKKIDLIINNQLPTYDWVIDISTQYIESQGWFSVSRSYKNHYYVSLHIINQNHLMITQL